VKAAERKTPEASMPTLAYFLTWTTYGTWLPGDDRGWIHSDKQGIQPPDPALEGMARGSMSEDAVILFTPQRELIEQTIRSHCHKRHWELHAVNARTNHVHVVVTANRDIEEVMNQLKLWCSRKLSDQTGLTEPVAKKAGRRHWFTEGGDKDEINDEQHLANAIHYVLYEQ
jgi:REP element-mobilizing transposase RayT